MKEEQAKHQRLIDALQTIAPLAQRLDATTRQQQQDATALLDAARRAIAESKPGSVRREAMTVADFRRRWLQVEAYRPQLEGLADDDTILVHVQYLFGAGYVIAIEQGGAR